MNVIPLDFVRLKPEVGSCFDTVFLSRARFSEKCGRNTFEKLTNIVATLSSESQTSSERFFHIVWSDTSSEHGVELASRELCDFVDQPDVMLILNDQLKLSCYKAPLCDMIIAIPNSSSAANLHTLSEFELQKCLQGRFLSVSPSSQPNRYSFQSLSHTFEIYLPPAIAPYTIPTSYGSILVVSVGMATQCFVCDDVLKSVGPKSRTKPGLQLLKIRSEDYENEVLRYVDDDVVSVLMGMLRLSGSSVNLITAPPGSRVRSILYGLSARIDAFIITISPYLLSLSRASIAEALLTALKICCTINSLGGHCIVYLRDFDTFLDEHTKVSYLAPIH